MRGLLKFSTLLLLLCGCSAPKRITRVEIEKVMAHLEVGDLLFRQGTGVVGQMVTSVDDQGLYSHVGVVVRRDSSWWVVHAVPHEPDFEGDIDRVKCERAEEFLGRYPDGKFGLYRPQITPEQRVRAAKHALRLSERRVPFDHLYNLSDSSHLYCTELVEYVYGLEGYSVSQGRRSEINLPSFGDGYLLPSDLTKNSSLKPIFTH